MDKTHILWADDEIDLLKPYILFLKEKGYEVIATNSGNEALDAFKNQSIDIVFLDENMPGLSGLETLDLIKNQYPNIPVVMITKSEEESIMEQAIGSKISDYLIKPVNPNQILLILKKHLDTKRLVSEKSTSSYHQEFRTIGMELSPKMSFDEWVAVYKKLVYWELELSKSEDQSVLDIFKTQKEDANRQFSKFIENNYISWLDPKTTEKPPLSHTVLREKMFPLLNDDNPTFFIVIDNLRYDQWKMIQPSIEQYFRVEKDELFCSILPSVTQYARNAMFSGLLPSEIEKKYPQLWVNEDEDGHKNQYEPDLLGEYLRRFGKQDVKYSYHKVLNITYGKRMIENMHTLMQNKLNVIVYNFVDMLSHARTDLDIIRELVDDEKAYRSVTLSWLEHSSPLMDILKWLSDKKANVVITTDHGSVRITHPVKVKGDKSISTNLRYKAGRLMDYNPKDVFEIKDPQKAFLPKMNVTSSYIFCKEYDFFAYPNNYNQYVGYYKNTFQHGGISLEELLIPFISLKPKM